METSTKKKRSRSYTGGKEDQEPKTPCETTPPNKRHTRSQSRKRSESTARVPTIPINLTDVVNNILEEEEAEERMSKTAQDLEAANVKNLTDMAKFLEDRISALPTKEYMDRRLARIEEKADDTANDLKSLQKRVENIEGDRSRNTNHEPIQAVLTS